MFLGLSQPSRTRRYALWFLAVAGTAAFTVFIFLTVSAPAADHGPHLRIAQGYVEQLAEAARQYREANGDWPESLEGLPAATIRAANASIPEEHRSRVSGGDCEDERCKPHDSVFGYRILYYGFVWPGEKRPLESRTCSDVSEPRLWVKTYHGRAHWWNWQRSTWQTRAYGELLPLSWHLAAVNDTIAWAVASDGIYAMTLDGGRTCRFGSVKGESSRQLVMIAPVTQRVLYLLSADGYWDPPGRVLRTVDGGATWQHQYSRDDLEFMRFGFWNVGRGVVLSRHASSGQEGYRRRLASDRNWIVVLRTDDSARTWQQASLPPLLRGETPKSHSLVLHGDRHAWFATYAEGDSTTRILRTSDGGRTWSAVMTSAKPALGIDLIAFRDTLNGVALGCGYVDNDLLRTHDGGRSWTPIRPANDWQRCSELTYLNAGGTPTIVVGADDKILYSRDGRRWAAIDSTIYNGIAPTRPWRTWVEHNGGWSRRWARDLSLRATR